MSYQGISVKEAINKVNGSYGGWFLPAIQRPYVWGSRYESEDYICNLFDSILKGYPIGGLIVWNTKNSIPYRLFMDNYTNNKTTTLVDKGLYDREDKWLIYDGQQRIQTLYSCLKYSFNNRVLVFNLLYDDSDNSSEDNTGFSFIDKKQDNEWYQIRMNMIFVKNSEENSTRFRKQILQSAPSSLTEEQEELIETNINNLWKIFVNIDTKSLAYFQIRTDNEEIVNEVFRRLNSGGMALTLSDLLFSKIKSEYYQFEESLQNCTKKIYNITGSGYLFNAYNILQLINLIVKKAIRVDPKKVDKNDIKVFQKTWLKLEVPLLSFFNDYLFGQFKINNSAIIPRKVAILPIIVFFYYMYDKGKSFKNISDATLRKVNKYFIVSQINDWSLQSYIDTFSKIIMSSFEENENYQDFPLDDFIKHVNIKRKRNTDLGTDTFVSYPWFALKILTPNRLYQFDPDIKGRFNPEIDHIFPKHLKGMDNNYRDEVDILWNLQPIEGKVNSLKTNHNPRDFFTNRVINRSGQIIEGSRYVGHYDYLFPVNELGDIDFTYDIWDDHKAFISKRKELMTNFLREHYDIILEEH